MGFGTVFERTYRAGFLAFTERRKKNMKGGPLMEVVPALQARSNTVPGIKG